MSVSLSVADHAESSSGPKSKSTRIEPQLVTGTEIDSDSVDRVRPRYYWTWRLLEDGYTTDECLAIRGFAWQQLIDDLTRAMDEGLSVRTSWFLSDAAVEWLANRVSADGFTRPLAEDLPEDISISQLELFVKCQVQHLDVQRQKDLA